MSTALQRRAQQDPYYWRLAYEGADDERLLAAGLFLDTLGQPAWEHPSWNVGWPTTPVGKLLDALEKLPLTMEPVVLLTTGSFSPVHRGHLAMMEAARSRLEQSGFAVIGGYFSASHDQYVSTKQAGAAALHIEQRLALLEDAVADSTWLHVCPWEGRYAPVALNFTDVVLRLKAYLRTQLRRNVEVAYVFGSDNAAFLEAFLGQGLAVCVRRPALLPKEQQLMLNEQQLAQRLRLAIDSSPERRQRLFWAEPVQAGESAHASSTKVRAGESHWLPAGAAARYMELRALAEQAALSNSAEPQKPPLYLLRADMEHAVQDWPVSPGQANRFYRELRQVLQLALQDTGYELQDLPMTEQKEICQHWCKGRPVLSLDACVAGHAQLALSRRFELSDGQVRSRVMVPRPGHSTVVEQLRALAPDRQWVVVDDDRATGQTRDYVGKLLSDAGVRVAAFDYLNESWLADRGMADREIADVVDARDFLLGARDSGLVVRLANGSTARAPYMLPFVNLAFRACIPAERMWSLSVQLWVLNEEWFASLPCRLRVRDAAPASQVLFRWLGFDSSTPLQRVCEQQRLQLLACGQATCATSS